MMRDGALYTLGAICGVVGLAIAAVVFRALWEEADDVLKCFRFALHRHKHCSDPIFKTFLKHYRWYKS